MYMAQIHHNQNCQVKVATEEAEREVAGTEHSNHDLVEYIAAGFSELSKVLSQVDMLVFLVKFVGILLREKKDFIKNTKA